MKKKSKLAVILVLIGSFVIASSVFALSDNHNEDQYKKIKHMPLAQGSQMTIDPFKSQVQAKPEEEIIVKFEKVNDQINKVLLMRENMPNPGYGIALDRIEFTSAKKAVAYYHMVSPDPKMMYPQVISTARTFFYMDSTVEVSAKESEVSPLIKLPDIRK